jgi:uncharacterized peroxidase-related enzyme
VGRFPREELRGGPPGRTLSRMPNPRSSGPIEKGFEMSQFHVHTAESAPADSVAPLRALEQGVGFVPNLAATMAESPALITGFVDLRRTLAGGELSGVEREIVALAVSLENDCDYCMAAHSTFALMQDADRDAVSAAREGREPADPRLGALYRFARRLVATKGHVTDEESQALIDAGYSGGAPFDVVAQVGHTTLANLAHGISKAPLDDAFRPQAWAKARV